MVPILTRGASLNVKLREYDARQDLRSRRWPMVYRRRAWSITMLTTRALTSLALAAHPSQHDRARRSRTYSDQAPARSNP
jgi:hypothetical protein